MSAPELHDTSSGVGLQPSDFASTAGTQNTGSYARYESLLPDSHRAGLFVSASYRFESGQELFAELLATRYKLDGVTTPPFLQLTNVPASNAFNPFGNRCSSGEWTVALGAGSVIGRVAGTGPLRGDRIEDSCGPPVGVGCINYCVSASNACESALS